LYIHLFDIEPPRSHNLAFLFDKLGKAIAPETLAFFNTLSAHYLNNRYPEYMHKLSSSLDEQRAKASMQKTEETYVWLKSLFT
jgi:HEPN domain-containing protein